MQDIPTYFWITIISSLTIGLLLVFYYLINALHKLSIVLEESRQSVKKSNKILETVDLMTEDARDAMNAMVDTLGKVRENVLQPLANVGTVAVAAKSFVEGLRHPEDSDDK